MKLRIRKIANECGVILPQSLMESMGMREGSLLEAEYRDGVLQMTLVDVEFGRQVEAFLKTEGEHRRSYYALAK